ncbi:uncharacterized protein LOC142496392 [Ascaphus truei]|uniref:uncharacterized protein LOC142496392 n=1 Tax=Ascaphus truei TaxID=8439 RepID=UPI003F59DE2D
MLAAKHKFKQVNMKMCTPALTPQPRPPARDTYAAIAASEERILCEDNRRHSELMTVHERRITQNEMMMSQNERMLTLNERMQERSISEMTQITKIILQVPKEIKNVNRTLEALVLNVSQGNMLRSTAREQFHFYPSQDGSFHGTTFSPQSSVLHSPVHDDNGTVADTSLRIHDNLQPLTSDQQIDKKPTNETQKRKLGQQMLLTSYWKKSKKQKLEIGTPSIMQCFSSASHLLQPTPIAPEVPQVTQLQQPTPIAPGVTQATQLPQPTPIAPEVTQATQLPQPTPIAPEVTQATHSGPEVTQGTLTGIEVQQCKCVIGKGRVVGRGRKKTQQPTSSDTKNKCATQNSPYNKIHTLWC